MTTPSNLIGIFGGTFDPIHLEHLPLHEIRFIPAQTPVHKNVAHASPHDRLAMLKIALHEQHRFVIDDRELKRKSPSFMVTTLQSLREDFPSASFCLILGMDALSSFTAWHEWQTILTLAHLVVDRKSVV